MKTKMIAILLTAALTICLTACSGQAPSSDLPQNSASDSAPQTVELFYGRVNQVAGNELTLDLAKLHNTAVMFISHDIALTRYISDNIAVMYLGKVVEYGKADEVVNNPGHPYTKALISNCASIDPDDEREEISITGEPPTPLDPGPGCYFAPRCFMACEKCLKEYPDKKYLSDTHWITCMNAE